MVPDARSHDLDAFHETGDIDCLLAFIGTSLLSSSEDIRVSTVVTGYFRSIENGERPDFRSVNREILASHAAAVIPTINWIAGSPKADFRSAAIELMGVLGWEAFLGQLASWAFDGEGWERLASIRSLGKMPSNTARSLLESLREDRDPAIAAAAGSALDPTAVV